MNQKGKTTKTGTTEKPKRNLRVANTLRQLAETGTVAGYVPEEDTAHTAVHQADEPDIQWVNIDLIGDSPFQHEEQIDPEKFAGLVASVQQEGLWQAFNVMEDPEHSGRYILTNGMHQRRKAAKVAGLTQVPIFVGPPLDRKRLAVRAARENTTDVNRSKVNLGYLFIQMNEELELTQEEIAAEIGQTREFVKFCIMAARSAPDIQQLVFEKPDSIRAMTYLRRIKPDSTPEEETTISQEEREQREAEAAALRAPIIEKFLSGDLSTDGVQIEVEKALTLREERKRQSQRTDLQEEETPSVHDTPIVIASSSLTEQSLPDYPTETATTVVLATHDLPTVMPSLSTDVSDEREQGQDEEQMTQHNVPRTAPSAVVSAPIVEQDKSRVSERLGQVRAILSRLQTYRRMVGAETLTEQEREVIGEIWTLVEQLLEAE